MWKQGVQGDFTSDNGIQLPPRRGWSLKWQCYQWALENTSEKRSRWGPPQSSEKKRSTKQLRQLQIPENTWTERSHTPSMCRRSPVTLSGTAGRGRRCVVQHSHLRSDHLDGSTDRCLRTKRKRCSLNKVHYTRPFLFLVQSITLRFSHRTDKEVS